MTKKHISKKYEYSYEVDDSTVDINALLISQLHFSTVVNEVCKHISPDIEINIRVIAPKEGSFVFQQLIDFSTENNLFSKDNVDYVSNVFQIVGSLYALKTWLKGKKADSAVVNGNDVKITFDGKTKNVSINVYNIYTKDKVVNSAIQKAFEAIESDESIDGLKIKNDAPIAEIKKEDFEALTSTNEYLDGETQEEIKPSVKLFIKNPDLVPKNPRLVKWDFLYEGITKMKATITDKAFLKNISTTEIRVGAYDALLADVKVISKYNDTAQVYLPSTYEVVKVHKVIYREKVTQGKIKGEGF